MKISRKLACGILAAGLTFMGASSASADDVPSQTEVVATSEAVVPAASDVVDTPPAPEPAEETVAPTVTAEEAPAPADVPEPVANIPSAPEPMAPVAEPEQPAQVTPAESVAPAVDILPAPEPDDATPPVLASLVKPNFSCNAGVGILTWLVTGDPNHPDWVGRVIGQNIATTPTFVGREVKGASKSLTGQQLDFQVGVDYQLRPTIMWLRDGDPTGLPYYSTYGGTVRPFSCVVDIPSTPGFVDPPNQPNQVIPPTWKDPLSADTDKIDWSESADGSTRTATLVVEGSTWTDETTAPKVFGLPSDDGVVVIPPVIVVDIPSTPGSVDPPNKPNQVIPPTWKDPLPADTDQNSWIKSADGSTRTATLVVGTPSTPGYVDQPNQTNQVIPPNSEGPLPADTDQNSLNESADGSTLTATPKLPGESFVLPIGLGIALALGILVLLVAWRRRRQERR
ncbi:hypothetical protein KC967_04630 [Candidatus Saccharibacteria bacterium]|nr:hypothetical protein [Candidatus Saccharibacteria bacterium]